MTRMNQSASSHADQCAQGHLRWTLLAKIYPLTLRAALLTLCCVACSPNLGADLISLGPTPDAGNVRIKDAEPITLLDMGLVVPPAPRSISPNGRALLVDFEMRHPMAWQGVISSLRALDVEVEYRRWFPHITQEDVDGRFGMLIVSAGGGPGAPSPMMRPDSVDALVTYARAGGGVLLATAHGWADAPRASNDIYRFNQLLETLGIRAWIESNTLVGDVFIADEPAPPLHTSQPWAYVTSLEWNIGLPVAFPGPDLVDTDGLDALALGWAPSISCAGGDIGILTRTHIDAYAWIRREGEMTLALPSEPLPVAILAPAIHGTVGIIPRSILEMPYHSSVGADQPLLEPGLLRQTERMATAALASWVSALRAPEPTAYGGCFHGSNPLPLASETPDRSHPLSERTVPVSPPELAQTEVQATESIPNNPPSWFRRAKGKLAYGELLPEDTLSPIVDQTAAAGMDGLVAYLPAQALIDYDPERAIAAHIAAGAERSNLLGAGFFLAAHYRNAAYPGMRDEVGPAIGAHGQEVDAPRPLSQTWWDANLAQIIMGAARASADHPGLTGLVLDLELYESGALTYADGYAFDEESWSLVSNALLERGSPGAEQAAELPVEARLPWLVDAGLVGFAYGQLEAEVARRAQEIMVAARSVNPDFQLLLYMHALQTTWFYRGFMRGVSSPETPLVLLTYDQQLRPAMDTFRAEGIAIIGLSGVLAVRLTAEDAETALFSAGVQSDGSWMFQVSDFTGDAAANTHSPPADYWNAFSRANAQLDSDP